MTAPNYSRWYRVGTASVTYNSKNVTGKDTYWLSSGLLPGDMFSTDNGDSFYEIDTITDNTHLTLKSVYRQATDSASAYSITRNFTATLPAQVAAQTTDLLLDMRRYLDNDIQTLKGKSAYEIACAKGYVGTESQWLDSLIGAGQWQTLNARTQSLTEYSGASRGNAHFRGKNLGSTITAAQYTAIKNGTFDDMYVGDYWTFGGVKHRIAHLDYFYGRNMYFAETIQPGDIPAKSKGKMTHHVILLPDASIITGVYHTEETAKNAYYGSNFWNEILPALYTKLGGYVGQEHLLEFQQTMPATVNDAHTQCGYTTQYVEASLLSVQELFGYPYMWQRNVNGNPVDNILWMPVFALFRAAPEYRYSVPACILRDYCKWTTVEPCAEPQMLWHYGQVAARNTGVVPNWFTTQMSYRPFWGVAVYS